MGARDLLVAASALVFLVMIPVAVRRHWRGEVSGPTDRGIMPIQVSVDTKQAFRRTMPVNSFAFFCCLVAWSLVKSDEILDSPLPDALLTGLVLAAVSLALVAVLFVSPLIVLFNRPGFLVAPPYRGEPGMLALRQQRQDRGR
ncbi:hypothetical protein [Streptomyces sp. NPDC058463]|uniref:hypothetical protein n=1 Tax=Streptomyces sp. NPDC058463 TaxID=3346510 RepID=UPI00365AE1FB